MALQEKYSDLITAAKSAGGIQVNELGGVLYIKGQASSAALKDRLWDLYGKADPNFLTGDVVMDVDVAGIGEGSKLKVTTDTSSLNMRKGPGTDQPLVGKAPHGGTVTLLSKTNDQWWLVRNDAGEEGYAYAQYLSPM
ncbi:MAG: SH3 domain-containing protein [Bacteroidota bacterium]